MKKFAFSLVELLAILVIISVILAAFAPVVTKKIKSKELAVGMIKKDDFKCEGEKFALVETGNGKFCVTRANMGDEDLPLSSAVRIIAVPSNINDDGIKNPCKLDEACCWQGQTAGSGHTEGTCDEWGDCWCLGDSVKNSKCVCKKMSGPADAGGKCNISNSGNSSYGHCEGSGYCKPLSASSTDNQTIFCEIKSGTSGCRATASDKYGYTGSRRTVCTYNAAETLCKNFNYGGKSWRLPTSWELEAMYEQDKTTDKDEKRIRLCSHGTGGNFARCDPATLDFITGSDPYYDPQSRTRLRPCPGTNEWFSDHYDSGVYGNCNPNTLWSNFETSIDKNNSEFGSSSDYTFYRNILVRSITNGNLGWSSQNPQRAFSVRCVTSM